MKFLSTATNLEVLRREAKRWLRAVRSGDAAAVQRLNAAGVSASQPGLRDVQHALALEYGLPGWIALKDRVEELRRESQGIGELVKEFLELACLNYGVRPGTATWDQTFADRPERHAAAARILARHPLITQASLHAAAAAGDAGAVRRWLSKRPESVNEPGGPHGWPPLLYLCFSRVPGPLSENAVIIARLLLEYGADPNVYFTDGANHFTPLTGAMGEGEAVPAAQPPHPQSRELARLLLDCGAEPFDKQGLYNTALWNSTTDWLDLLHQHSRRSGSQEAWTRRENGPRMIDILLDMAVTRNHLERVRWLIDHGADATAPGHYTKRPLHLVALLHGFISVAEVLERAGAPITALSGYQAFQAACLSGDESGARRIAETNPAVLRQAAPLLIASQSGNVRAVERLLDLGVDPNVEGPHQPGRRALHTAAAANSPAIARLLLERGAQVDPVEKAFQATPLGWAVHHGHAPVIEVLAPLSRDLRALARAGCTARLRELFHSDPSLARPELLFCLPSVDDCALELAELLVGAGAAPHVRNAEGRTPAEHAAFLGLDDTAAFLDPS